MKLAIILLSVFVLSATYVWIKWILKQTTEIGSFKGFLHSWWNNELYTNLVEESKRKEVDSVLGIFAVSSYCFGRILSNTFIILPNWFCTVFYIYIPFVVFLLQYLYFTKLSLKEILLIVLELCPFIINTLTANEGLLIAVVVILCCAQIENLKTIIKANGIIIALILLLTFVLSSNGIINTADEPRFANALVNRHTLGLITPNIAGIYIAIVVECYLLVRFNSIKWYDWIIALVAIVFIEKYVDSRGSFISLSIIVALLACFKYFPSVANNKIFKWLIPTVPVLIAFITVYLAYFYNQDNAFMAKLNKLLTTRLAQNNRAVSLLPLKLFGTNTDITTQAWSFIHNASLKYLISGGVFVFCLFIIWNVVLMVRLVKLNALPEIAMAIGSYAYWIVEELAAWPQFSIYMFLMGSVILAKPIKDQQLFH